MTDVEKTPTRLLATAGIRARRGLGQHFLLDLNLCRRIARLAAPPAGSLVLEVGPGPGSLTRALIEAGARVLAIEKDARFIPLLQGLADAAPGKLRVIHADALAADEGALGAATAIVVANLPYNIGTALLIKWLTGAFQPRTMTLMFQKEVAERIVASPGERAYGRLAVLTQTLCEAHLAFTVPARAFTPAPKVDSAVVHLEKRPSSPSPDQLIALQRVTRAAFGHRRKMLRSALAQLDGESLCVEAGVDPKERAERLDLAAFQALAEALAHHGTGTGPPQGLFPGRRSKEDIMDETKGGSAHEGQTRGPAQAGSIQGEGDYEAARRFDKDEEAFVKSGRVEENARKAADALDGPEGEELEAARKSTAEGLAAPKDD